MKKKLIEILEAYDKEFDLLELECEEKPYIEDGLSITCEKMYGGSGKGEEYWMVIRVVDERGNLSFWKIPGWYQSHHGGELEIENMFEVVPQEQTVIVYKKKK